MEYDVIILGGGVNGLGTARDCAMRGLRALLLEKGDLAGGASGAGSGLLLGGPGAPWPDPAAARLAGQEAAALRAIAPHLLFRLPSLVPFASAAEGDALAERMARQAAEVDLGDPGRSPRPVRLAAEALYALEPGLRPGLHGAIAFDEWSLDGHRLCVASALSARDHGAELRTWTEAREVVREAGRVVGVRWLDALSGETGLARAPVVLNATGAWAPGLAGRSGVTVPLRPRKGVHLVLAGRLGDHAVVGGAADERALVVAPHGDETWIGATAADFHGDPDDVEATHDEVASLLEGAAWLLPAVRQARIARAFAGLRATPPAAGPGQDPLARAHRLVDHAAEGAAGLLSLVGGRLAAYRAQAEAATDRILAALSRPPVPCTTREEVLPGGEAPVDVAALAATHRVAGPVARRLVSRHGARAAEVLGLADEDPRLGLLLCREEGILAAEVAWCCRHELVRRLRDLRSRCRLSVGACGGLDCARVAAQVAARELGWCPERARAELADLLEVGWRERRAVLDGAQLTQEELLRGAHWGVGQ